MSPNCFIDVANCPIEENRSSKGDQELKGQLSILDLSFCAETVNKDRNLERANGKGVFSSKGGKGFVRACTIDLTFAVNGVVVLPPTSM